MSKVFSIEEVEYHHFRSRFDAGDYGKQRLGQAFYNHFNLHKMTNQTALQNIYDDDGRVAEQKIASLFEFT